MIYPLKRVEWLCHKISKFVCVCVCVVQRIHLTLLDYAGQPEYYLVHETMMTSDGNCLYLVMCNLEDDTGRREYALQYWLRFIKTRHHTATTQVPLISRMCVPRVCHVCVCVL